METIQQELFKVGAVIIDVMRVKDYSDKMLEHYLCVKSDYWDTMPGIGTIPRIV